MAIIIEAPNEVYSVENKNNVKLFLCGSIETSDWQNYVIKELSDVEHLTIYNPRRKNFSINDPKATEEQITWEFTHLRDSTVVLFWFAKGSLNPIVLFEYGAHGVFSNRPIIVGIDPEYERKQDVIIQTQLARPKQIIHSSIQDMIEEVSYMLKEFVNNEEEDDD